MSVQVERDTELNWQSTDSAGGDRLGEELTVVLETSESRVGRGHS